MDATLQSGCRYGELTAFKVEDFDATSGTVLARSTKSGKSRHVVLTDDGVALFRAHTAGKTGQALIFVRSDGLAWGKSHQHRRLRAACARANITPAASFHVLRHPVDSIRARWAQKDLQAKARYYSSPQSGWQDAPSEQWRGGDLRPHFSRASTRKFESVPAIEQGSSPIGIGDFGPVGPDNVDAYMQHLSDLLLDGAISRDDWRREMKRHVLSIKRQNVPPKAPRPELIPQPHFTAPDDGDVP